MGTKSVRKKVNLVSFQPPSSRPGSPWYDWAIHYYNRAFTQARPLDDPTIEELRAVYRWGELVDARQQGARFEQETGCFLLPTQANLWEGVKDVPKK